MRVDVAAKLADRHNEIAFPVNHSMTVGTQDHQVCGWVCVTLTNCRVTNWTAVVYFCETVSAISVDLIEIKSA